MAYARGFNRKDFCRLDDLKFGHRSVKDQISDGGGLDDLARDILYGRTSAQQVPPLEVKEHNGEPYVVEGNRRLKTYKSLADAGFDVGPVPVKYSEDPSARVLVRPGEGDDVKVRGSGDQIDDDIRAEKDNLEVDDVIQYAS